MDGFQKRNLGFDQETQGFHMSQLGIWATRNGRSIQSIPKVQFWWRRWSWTKKNSGHLVLENPNYSRKCAFFSAIETKPTVDTSNPLFLPYKMPWYFGSYCQHGQLGFIISPVVSHRNHHKHWMTPNAEHIFVPQRWWPRKELQLAMDFFGVQEFWPNTHAPW